MPDNKPLIYDKRLPMSKRRHVAIQLELEWSYKHHAAMFVGTQQYAEEHGWQSTVDEFVDDTLAAENASKSRGGQSASTLYDGVIARASKQLAEQSVRTGVPVVNVWVSCPVRVLLPGVFPDMVAAGRLRAEHLLSRGLRRFGVLVGRSDIGDALELAEFRQAVEAAGGSCVCAKIPLNFSATVRKWRQTEQALNAWMDQWELPIGVFIGPDDISRQVAQMCRARGWRVPEDVAIIAGINEETICEAARPQLSSVEFGYERIGYEAARMLDRLMDERDQAKGRRKKKGRKKSQQPEHILLPPKGLVVRESTDFFTLDDEDIAAAMEFIAANCHRPIEVDDVAKATHLHTRTLQRRFEKQLGRTIVSEIRRVRIERAKRELVQTDRTATEIARAVGFRDANRMYEVFVREVGVSPSQYRKERQIGDGA